MIKQALADLAHKIDLSYEVAKGVMDLIMNGEGSNAQVAAYLMGLRLKGESIEEITASAQSMRNHCTSLKHNMQVLEIVGTGGDKSNSFNISTTASLVVSAAGIPVAKHGNCAASSKCGAADVLEALGININLSPADSATLLKDTNFCFLFAQQYHQAMRFVAPIRKELGIPTIFNLLGPLSNPARATMQLMGVYEENLVEPLARVLSNLGVKRGMVVFGMDVLDELSLSDDSKVCEINDGRFKSYYINPSDVGLKRCKKIDLIGGDAKDNATIIRDILNGRDCGARRDVVCLNAGAAFYIAKKSKDLDSGIALARDIIVSGKGIAQLEQLIQQSNSFKN